MWLRQSIIPGLLIASIASADTAEIQDPALWQTQGGASVSKDTVNFTYYSGTASQTYDLSTYEQINTLTVEAMVEGCNNFIGGWCGSTNTAKYDDLVVTIKVDNVTVATQTFTADFHNPQTVSLSYDHGGGTAQTAGMYFMSMDKGYWAGNFGPTVSDAAFIIDYTIPLTLDPALDMVFTQPDLMFDLPPIPHMPPPLDDFSPMESASLESEVPVIEAPRMSAAPVSEPSLMKDEPTVEKTEGVASEPMRDTAQNTTEQKVEQVVVSVGDKNASMETVAAAIGSSYDPVAQSVALSIMTGTEKFEDTFLEDVAFYAPTAIVDKRIADRIWGSLFADDKRWNEMVDSQYEYGN